MAGHMRIVATILISATFVPLSYGHYYVFPENPSPPESGVPGSSGQNETGLERKALPPDYPTRTASFKLDYLWGRIQENAYTTKTLPMKGPTAADLAKLLIPTFLQPVFTHTSDELPQGRKKFAHPFGTVAKVQLEIFPNSTYTGVFKSGGMGVTRFSWGTFDPKAILPGFAVKILIDGRPSQNILTALPSGDQGSNRNFFLKPLSTIFQEPTDLSAQMINKAFEACLALLPAFYNPAHPSQNDRLEYRGNLGLYEQASVSANGKMVPDNLVVTPWKLDFIPNRSLTASQNGRTDDFRAQLGLIPANTVLYDVVAYRTKESKSGETIGRLTSRSGFVASRYGDEGIHFQHAHKRWQPAPLWMNSAWLRDQVESK